MAVESSRTVRSTWLYTLAGLVFFVGFVALFVALIMLEAFVAQPDVLTAIIIVVQLIAAVTQIRFCFFLRVGRGGGLPGAAWTVALVVPAVTVWVLGLFSASTAFTAATATWSAASLLVCLMSGVGRWVVLLAGGAALVAHPLLTEAITGEPIPMADIPGVWSIALFALLLLPTLWGSLWWWESVVELDRHRRAAADLAVTRERLRFAADLHDIQGHHLQVISLKAELAERMLAIDVEAAREHIHEVRVIAKAALEETRSLVGGYREVALADELGNAREVLTAAGAECTLRLLHTPDDAVLSSALASVVREATTNILRHSDAAHVSIVLSGEKGRHVLEIANDGVHASPGGGARPSGTGLVGLRERLAGVGGTLESDAAGERFVLRAVVPIAVAVDA